MAPKMDLLKIIGMEWPLSKCQRRLQRELAWVLKPALIVVK